MKFDMNIFLPVAALALVQVSAEDSEETRKLQYGRGPSGYGPPGRAKGRGKPKKAKKGSPPPKRSVEHKCESPEPSACAAKFCDVKFKIANGYYRKLEGENESDRNLDEVTQGAGYYAEYGGGHGGYGYKPFTRENCKWTPSKAGTDYECPALVGDEVDACECFWKFEAQCVSNVCDPEPKSCAGQIAHGEREIDLALDVREAILAGGLCGSHYYRNLEKTAAAGYYSSGGHGYGGYCPFDECFSDDIYNCLCAGQDPLTIAADPGNGGPFPVLPECPNIFEVA